MDWDATYVEPLPDYRIYVELESGRKGIFDVKPYLDRGVLRELRMESAPSALIPPCDYPATLDCRNVTG